MVIHSQFWIIYLQIFINYISIYGAWVEAWIGNKKVIGLVLTDANFFNSYAFDNH